MRDHPTVEITEKTEESRLQWSCTVLNEHYQTVQEDEMATFIAYYRVSTTKQGRSGLGVEAQQAAVERYLNGGPTARKGPSPRSPPGSNGPGPSGSH